jgi:hypothetical protein
MRETVLRCHKCGHARETKRSRDPISICFCLPWEGEPVFVEVTQPRDLVTPSLKFVQRE